MSSSPNDAVIFFSHGTRYVTPRKKAKAANDFQHFTRKLRPA
jgi:hypothetical protein